jgi:hypothetical protein
MPHVNSDKKRNCRDCRHSLPLITNVVGCWVAECRRFPPLVLIVPDKFKNQMIIKWPVVEDDANFYCFEFEKEIRPGDVVSPEPPQPSAGYENTLKAIDSLDEQIKILNKQLQEFFDRK